VAGFSNSVCAAGMVCSSGTSSVTTRPWLLLVVLAVGAWGCRDAQLCQGVATCYGAEASTCQKLPGCAPTAGCMISPTVGADCPTATTAAGCAALASCSWANGSCSEPCSAAADQATCNAMTLCSWSACTGVPVACGKFSANSCPTSPLGCFVGNNPNGTIGE
jgi:hypothetical protein